MCPTMIDPASTGLRWLSYRRNTNKEERGSKDVYKSKTKEYLISHIESDARLTKSRLSCYPRYNITYVNGGEVKLHHAL